MTKERMKSIGVLVATLVIGVLLGLLIPGFYHKARGRNEQQGNRGSHEYANEKRHDWFEQKLTHILGADSTQRDKIKPIATWAAARLESIETSAKLNASHVLDSMKVQLRPIVTDEQMQKLEAFERDAKSKWQMKNRGH